MKSLNISGLSTALVLMLVSSAQAQTYPSSLVSYWDFDESNTGTTTALDQKSSNDGGFTGGATRTNGIIGTGAALFTDIDGESVNVGTTGAGNNYTVVDGITIEALFQSNWDGTGFDHIFRKEDAGKRILLSFQADASNGVAVPPVAAGPVLSFGLVVDGVYSELDMPLDGAAGRPTLAELTDGNTHHVVAKYEVLTGLKAIYIDGSLRYTHSFGVGDAISTGGGIVARIGSGHSAGIAAQAFEGIIDEVAFYNAALSSADVLDHWKNVQLNLSYFDNFEHIAIFSGEPLQISGDQVVHATVGNTIRERIRGGVAPYTLFSGTAQYAIVSINGSRLTIEPYAVGTMAISVLDSEGQISTIAIIVREADIVANALSMPAETATDSSGNSTSAQISGGVINNSDGMVFLNNAVITAGEEFEILAVIYPELGQIGEEAGIIVALIDTASPETILMLNSNGQHSVFDGTSIPFFNQVVLEESNVVDITAGNALALTLDDLGLFNIYVGYQLLSEEAIFYNSDPIVLDIVQ